MTAAETLVVPRRVRTFDERMRRVNPFFKLMMGRDPTPTRAEYDDLVAGLWRGDPAMDELLDWLYTLGPKEGRQLFEQALSQGIGSLDNPPEPLQRFFQQIEKAPSWADFELMNEGALFIHRAAAAGPFVLRDLALMGGYLLSGFNHALVLTGALNKGAAQRIAETGKWWMDCTEIDGMTRFGPGFATTVQVRMVHALVRRHLPNRKEWDNNEWGIPVNQTDMLATYLAFGPVMLTGLRALGIPVTRQESRAVMHLWKYVGWLMGVDEKWLVDDERTGLVRVLQTFQTQSRPDWTSEELGRELSKEALERSFPVGKFSPRLQEMVRRYHYWRHLSVSALFLTPKQMKQLGLPSSKPWYPLLSLLPRATFYSVQRFNPLLAKRLAEKGRKEQRRLLESMFGDAEHRIINPDGSHPAKV